MRNRPHSPCETMAAAAYVMLWDLLESAEMLPSGIKPNPSFAWDDRGGLYPNPAVIDAVNRSLPKGSARDNLIAAFAPYSNPQSKTR